MTARIQDFLRHRTEVGPCLVVDLDVVRNNYQAFAGVIGATGQPAPMPDLTILIAGLPRSDSPALRAA